MTAVIILGGGLTGLAAAWELEQLGVSYALVEVKSRLGGSISTEHRDGFVLDGSAFISEKYGEWSFLDPLGLADELARMGVYRDGELVAFRHGTQRLIDALARQIKHPVYQRMAASSVGIIGGGRCGVCLENGIMLQSRAVIVTVPARYAAHLLYSLNSEAALLVSDYHYDPVARVSLGYAAESVDLLRTGQLSEFQQAGGNLVKFCEFYAHEELPERIPPGYVLARVGVRLSEDVPLERAAEIARAYIGAAQPAMTWTYFWGEADPLTCYLPEHATNMDALDSLLPPNVAIAGSDYRGRRINDRVDDGRAAAAKVAASL